MKRNPAITSWDWSGEAEKWSQEQKLASLHPEFRSKIVKVLAELREEGWDPTIHFGWRDAVKQAELKAQGKSNVSFSFHNVTDADGHPAALAVDLPSKSKGWSASQAYWEAVGRVGEKHGLVWGGRWKKPWDPAHLQGAENNELSVLKSAGLSAIGYASRVTKLPVKWGLIVYAATVSVGLVGLGYLIWTRQPQRR